MSIKSLAQKIHRIEYSPEWEGKRLKEALRLAMPALASRPAFLLIKNGLVRDGGGAVLDDADMAVPEGQPLCVDLRHGIHGRGESEHPHLHERFHVMHDDADIVVVSKRPWTLVQPIDDGGPPAKGAKGAPLVELLEHYWKAKGQRHSTPIVVQRLDLQTSGLLVIAKTTDASSSLQRQLKPPRKMHRDYIAITAGEFIASEGTWKTYQGRGKLGTRQTLAEDTRPANSVDNAVIAETRFKVVERKKQASMLRLELETGRTHQIRIHCAEAGHPLLGDDLYRRLAESILTRLGKQKIVPRSPLNPAQEALALVRNGQLDVVEPERKPKRVLLHATRLSFLHPRTGKRVSFEDPMPDDMRRYWEKLE